MKCTGLIVASLISLTRPLTAIAQPSMKSTSAFELNVGVWNELKPGQFIATLGMEQEAKPNGIFGGLTYCYWMREYVAVTASGSLLSTKSTTTVNWAQLGARMPSTMYQNTAAMISFLVGVRYFVPRPEPGDDIRPFLSIAMGSFTGHESIETPLLQSAHSESTFGGRLAAGVDVFVGNKVKLGVNIGFNAMTDFQNTISARKNFNGGDGSIGIGYAFGN